LSIPPKFSVAGLYSNHLTHYTDSTLNDNSYNMNDFSGRIYYHVTPKVDVYVNGTGSFTNYYKSDLFDSQGFSVDAGLVGKLTDKLVLNVQAGYKGRDYDDDSINTYKNIVTEGVLKYDLTSKTDVFIRGKRGIEESVYATTGWYQSDLVSAGFDYHVTPYIHTKFSGSFQANNYPRETTEGPDTKKRKDFFFRESLTLRSNKFRIMTELTTQVATAQKYNGCYVVWIIY